jgi:hypothetical protein
MRDFNYFHGTDHTDPKPMTPEQKIKDLKKKAPLTPEQENIARAKLKNKFDLFYKVRCGNEEEKTIARNQLVVEYQTLAYEWLHAKIKDTVINEDMKQASIIFLIHAVESFDMSLGNKFSTHLYNQLKPMLRIVAANHPAGVTMPDYYILEASKDYVRRIVAGEINPKITTRHRGFNTKTLKQAQLITPTSNSTETTNSNDTLTQKKY